MLFGPTLRRGSSEYHPCQVRHRRRYLMGAKNHAVATRPLLGQAPGLESEFPVNREIHLIVRTPEGGEERLFVLYSMVRGKITLAAKAVSSATGLEIAEKEQMAQRVME